MLVTEQPLAGTYERLYYTRANDTDPWTLSSTTTLDIVGNLYCTIDGGGHPISGGKGSDDNSKKISVGAVASMETDDGTSFLFGVGGDSDPTETDIPYPWDSPWPNVSSIFTTDFATTMAGYSGTHNTTGSSCSLSLDWTY